MDGVTDYSTMTDAELRVYLAWLAWDDSRKDVANV